MPLLFRSKKRQNKKKQSQFDFAFNCTQAHSLRVIEGFSSNQLFFFLVHLHYVLATVIVTVTHFLCYVMLDSI